jgi:hypothetical protein
MILDRDCETKGSLALKNKGMETEYSVAIGLGFQFTPYREHDFADLHTSSYFTTIISSEEERLLWSCPVYLLKRSLKQVEAFSVRLNSDGVPISVGGTLRKTVAVTLGKTILLDYVTPAVAKGPYVVQKELKRQEDPISDEETPVEEPSFLRKYWWLIVGAMILSSILSPADNQVRGDGTGEGSTK